MVKLDADPEVAFGKFRIWHGLANLRGVRSAVEGGTNPATPEVEDEDELEDDYD